MKTIRVVVHGASGKMGRETLAALCGDPETEPVGAVARSAKEDYLPLPDGSGLIPYAPDLEAVLARLHPDVVVDFTSGAGALAATRACAKAKVGLVTGSTGLSDAALAEMKSLAELSGIGIVVAPNFALGAVVLIYLARLAGRHFDSAEIIEMHHDAKADAPSGTALATARAMVAERGGKPFVRAMPTKETVPGTRGGEESGVSLHAVRLPGLMAHQEVILGAAGQTLRLRHDTISRECYMPGVLLAVKAVGQRPGLTYGMEALLGLS
ncbi:MAG: 4-hydroxy-tetrahydrodipicolinate reductase [Chloroflexi bacterium]|nr:4-hydroxy-tetrahydrodipicolinate reductase [Chloroflexota bacterium]